jgi:uncharacterized membrane protein
MLCVAGAVLLFLITLALDQAAHRGAITLPAWVKTGGTDAGRSVLIGIAAAVITVVGVVFSVTILALTLASQQFGPRMMRTFIRDRGTQVTLGVFVGSFVYTVLVLVSITDAATNPFVPHVGITVSEALMFVDIAVLIYFIHHVAVTIQLPEVIARVAADLGDAIDEAFPDGASNVTLPDGDEAGRPVGELIALLDREGGTVPSLRSGYLQFVGYGQVLQIAESADAVIRLVYRPGHFILAGRPLATVWPCSKAETVARALSEAHITGPQRTLAQDPAFPIDQLVEIAIRALSPAVNDTFTALTCIDWLADGLCKVSSRVLTEGVYRDRSGYVRLIEPSPTYARMVRRAFDKVRQAARGMPAVLIRLMDALLFVTEYTRGPDARAEVLREARMVLRAGQETIADPEDLADLASRYERLLVIAARLDSGEEEPRVWNGKTVH